MRFEALTVGETLVFSDVLLSRAAVIDFARDYDPQPFHLSDAAAAKTYFGRIAASGWHTASAVLSRLADDAEAGLALAAIAEISDLRWRAPVYPEQSLSVTAEVLAAEALDAHIGELVLAVAVADGSGQLRFSMRCKLHIHR